MEAVDADFDEVIDLYSLKTEGVHVMSVDKYLHTFCSEMQHVLNLYQSLAASLQISSANDGDYTCHLRTEELDAGIRRGSLIQGIINVNKHNAQNEAFVRPSGISGKSWQEDGQDILILGTVSRNRAIHGDVVCVELLPKKMWQPRSRDLKENQVEGHSRDLKEDDEEALSVQVMPTGRVVGIVQRRWRDYTATFEVSQGEETSQTSKSGRVLVIPMDWRIPKIRIATSQAETLKNHRIVVRVDSWEIGSQYPNGHFVRDLGCIGNLETEVAAILTEHNISVPPFSDALLAEMPVNTECQPWEMSADEIQKRRDLRQSHLIFSIDPKGCEDVDDALSIRQLDNGHLQLGVHIADVTHFVAAGSLADHEASVRSTTVYLADRRYDMLPAVLSADLCSLHSGVDRYAVSVIWELDDDCQVVDVWYGRTVIHSSYKLFYEFAQSVFDGASDEEILENVPELRHCPPESLKQKISALRWSVDALICTARRIHAGRSRQGALQLEGVEVQVQIDRSQPQQTVEDVLPKQTLEIHETIAECMIFANHWVAKKIAEAFPQQALLRRHPLPRQEDFAALVACAASRGFSIQSNTNKDLADSLDHCVLEVDPHFNQLLRSLATQAMSVASYFSTGSLSQEHFFHYGLALQRYTHFTSPIRRYADILVHRQLLAAIGLGSVDDLPGNTALQEMADHINNRHKMAQDAQKASVKLYQCLFFRAKDEDDPCRVADAIIFRIKSNGLLVFVPRYGLRGAIYLQQKDGKVAFCSDDQGVKGQVEWVGGSVRASEDCISVITPLGDQTYRLMEHITVRILVEESHAHGFELKLELVSNRTHTATAQQTDAKGQKAQMIQEVAALSQDAPSADDLGADFHRLKAQYGQTDSGHSFYMFWRDLQEKALTRERAGFQSPDESIECS